MFSSFFFLTRFQWLKHPKHWKKEETNEPISEGKFFDKPISGSGTIEGKNGQCERDFDETKSGFN